MLKKPDWPLLLIVIFVAALSIWLSASPPAVNTSPGEHSFSVERAYQHLQQIARAPHSTGTVENGRVRDYIAATCRELGLDTYIQQTTGFMAYRQSVEAGKVYNIIARIKGEGGDKIKGEGGSKAVLITAHYDSQPNAAGAGDDGAGCAAMLETARLLRSGQPLKNDIIFLFTDGEERGLLGAGGFVREDSLVKDIGVVLNFEGRGNAGVSHMFETNPDNGWVIREYAKSAAHLFAGSLNYEIYKLLPNNTDYSIFKEAGISGLNHSFIEGFVNYHSMTDRPENLDRGSFQDHGDNMLTMARYFGNIDLVQTKAPDMIYFDIVGDWLVLYPSSLNLFFLILGNLLLIGYIVMGAIRSGITIKGMVAGTLLFPLVLVVLYYLGSFFFSEIRSAYPLYNNFYASNSYNAHYYFFAVSALAIAVFSLIYQWAGRNIPIPALYGGILLTGTVAVDLLYFTAPTAIYFLDFPLIFATIACLLQFRKTARSGSPWITGIINLVFLLPAILLMAPVINSSFAVFGLTSGSAVPVVLLGLLLGLLLPLLLPVYKTTGLRVALVSLVCFLVAVITGHLQSGFNEKRPLQTNVRYLLDADEGKAYWASEFGQTDKWNAAFFRQAKTGSPIGDFDQGLFDEAPLLGLQGPVARVQKDTVENGMRKLYLHCLRGRPDAISSRFIFGIADAVVSLTVNGREVKGGGWKRGTSQPQGRKSTFRYLEYNGIDSAGYDVVVGALPGTTVDFYLIDRSMGLPEIKGFPQAYPGDVIPGPGDNSNTTQVAKHYTFR